MQSGFSIPEWARVANAEAATTFFEAEILDAQFLTTRNRAAVLGATQKRTKIESPIVD